MNVWIKCSKSWGRADVRSKSKEMWYITLFVHHLETLELTNLEIKLIANFSSLSPTLFLSVCVIFSLCWFCLFIYLDCSRFGERSLFSSSVSWICSVFFPYCLFIVFSISLSHHCLSLYFHSHYICFVIFLKHHNKMRKKGEIYFPAFLWIFRHFCLFFQSSIKIDNNWAENH